jgi:hypothetical protein
MLPFASAAGKPAQSDLRQRMPREGLVTRDSLSTTDFVSTFLSASKVEYPRLMVERAFLHKVD